MEYSSSLMESSSVKKRITITLSPELVRELRSIQAESMLEAPKSFSRVISILLTESLLHRKAEAPMERVSGMYSY